MKKKNILLEILSCCIFSLNFVCSCDLFYSESSSNFDPSIVLKWNAISKCISESTLNFDPSIVISSSQIRITQQANYSFESNEIKENPVLLIKWPANITNINKVLVQEMNTNFDKEIDYPKYSALSVKAKYDTSYRIIITPYFSNKYGSSVEILYTTDKNKNIEPPSGKELSDGIQEIDCSMEAATTKF